MPLNLTDKSSIVLLLKQKEVSTYLILQSVKLFLGREENVIFLESFLRGNQEWRYYLCEWPKDRTQICKCLTLG